MATISTAFAMGDAVMLTADTSISGTIGETRVYGTTDSYVVQHELVRKLSSGEIEKTWWNESELSAQT